MTFPSTGRIMSRLERWAIRIMVFCAVGTVLCIGGLAWLNIRVSGQARAGQAARMVQTAKLPVAIKIAEFVHAAGGITDGDLACYRSKSGGACPVPPPSRP